MKYSFPLTIIIALLVKDASSLSCGKALYFDETPCTAGLIDDIVIGNACNAQKIRMEIQKKFIEVQDECGWNLNYELQLMTGTLSPTKANMVLEELCDDAQAMIWTDAPKTSWTDIDSHFTADFMDEYTDGGTFLNIKTGNFRNVGGSCTSPEHNIHYPTDEESYLAGQSIDGFYKEGARHTVLSEVNHLSTCENQAIMCCFGRDRQYGDGNGNCSPRDCDDADPGDNSNLCYVSDDENPVAYPDDEAIHCHGLAWADDVNDPSYQLRFNNFFYVLMHDHMYTRGYVGSAVDDVPMCSCVEDMPKVVRADCSQIQMETEYFISLSQEGVLSVSSADLNFSLQACRGKTINELTGQVKNKNNDLAAYINNLFLQEKLSEPTRMKLFETLVGHDTPNDTVNEDACIAAWEAETQGSDYTSDVLNGEE